MHDRKITKYLLILLFIIMLAYGCGRLYYVVTAGFTIGNITSELPYNQEWNTRSLTDKEFVVMQEALKQEYDYLSRGRQSYVFLSRDGKYVIKFFKFQRFRPQAWINLLTFVPAIDRYQQDKTKEKASKINHLFKSCKIAFDVLKEETGVVYVHLNKTDHLNQMLTIHDKLGLTHHLDLDQLNFIIQYRAEMFDSSIDEFMQHKEISQAEALIDRLLVMFLSEYHRGYADNDHALMQNTGVFHGHPIHVDIGQFIHNSSVKDPEVYNHELFKKTTQLSNWLIKYPELLDYLNNRLLAIIGPDYFIYPPYIYDGGVSKMPHQD